MMQLDTPTLPRRLPPAELLTPDEMARADASAPGLGMPGQTLMEAAGRAVARAAMRRFRPGRTLVLCGPGNNGGDGYVAARLLAQAGWPVAVAALGPPRPETDAVRAAARWHGPMADFAPAEAARAHLVIDAVFGAGLSREIPGPVADTLAASPQVLAVDVPSGLDGATGTPLGQVRRADTTVTFFRAKPGHLLLPGRQLCGALVLADIGMPEQVLAAVGSRTWINLPSLWTLPAPAAESHKYTRGHVTIVAGAAMTGAARMAAAAARRAGAGLVTIAAAAGGDLYRVGDPGLLVSDSPIGELLQDARRNAWVCGPGLGIERARSVLPLLLASGRQVVVDADGLTACAGAPGQLAGASVLTPHAGEFARVFGKPGRDRVAAVRAAASSSRAVVVLKGADTVIAAPDGRVAINASAPPWLATAGSGDVLAGLVGSLLGQGMAPWEAACAAVWLHARAAASLGAGLLAEDLPGAIAWAQREAEQASAFFLKKRTKKLS